MLSRRIIMIKVCMKKIMKNLKLNKIVLERNHLIWLNNILWQINLWNILLLMLFYQLIKQMKCRRWVSGRVVIMIWMMITSLSSKCGKMVGKNYFLQLKKVMKVSWHLLFKPLLRKVFLRRKVMKILLSLLKILLLIRLNFVNNHQTIILIQHMKVNNYR